MLKFLFFLKSDLHQPFFFSFSVGLSQFLLTYALSTVSLPRMLMHSSRLPSPWTWPTGKIIGLEGRKKVSSGHLFLQCPLFRVTLGLLLPPQMMKGHKDSSVALSTQLFLSPGSSYLSVPSLFQAWGWMESSFCVISLMSDQTFVNNPFIKPPQVSNLSVPAVSCWDPDW